MKKVYLSLLTVIFLGSCSNNDSETTEENKINHNNLSVNGTVTKR
jgi:hypothetical protein